MWKSGAPIELPTGILTLLCNAENQFLAASWTLQLIVSSISFYHCSILRFNLLVLSIHFCLCYFFLQLNQITLAREAFLLFLNESSLSRRFFSFTIDSS